uniref:Ubiquitin-like protease family profile domain-containing protein n=1 Tax=Amphimedon queenslandica TaxID=400682 RepID=A0A1X7VBH8_AMPQE
MNYKNKLVFCYTLETNQLFEGTDNVQVGSVDCGVFVLAFASVSASGRHPSSHHFEQQLIRGHPEKCIAIVSFKPFPVRKLGRQNNKVRLMREIAIFYDCRMPEIFSKK